MSETYGQRLRQARKAAGLTLRELAERCGVDFTYISHLEHNRARPSVALGRAFTAELGADLLPAGEVARLLARVAALEEELAELRERCKPTSPPYLRCMWHEPTDDTCPWCLRHRLAQVEAGRVTGWAVGCP